LASDIQPPPHPSSNAGNNSAADDFDSDSDLSDSDFWGEGDEVRSTSGESDSLRDGSFSNDEEGSDVSTVTLVIIVCTS
jgi:hypothetical protein